MKTKKLLSLALIMLSSTAGAISKDDIDISGSMQLRAEGKREYTSPSLNSDTLAQYRFRINTNLKVSDDLTIKLTPQADHIFGKVNAQGRTSGATNNPSLTFFQAYADFKLATNWSMTLGRQALSYGSQLIIGPLGWSNSGRSFDAAKVNYRADKNNVDLFFSRISDNGTSFDQGDDTNLYGLYWDFEPGFTSLDFYFFHQRGETGTEELEINTAGARAEGQLGQFSYELEGGLQNGKNVGEEAYQVYTKIDMDLWDSTQLFIDYALAGKNYRQLYPTAHKFLGVSDKFGRRNIKQYGLGTKFKYSEKTSLTLHYLSFKRADENAPMYKLNGQSPWASRGSSPHVGDEIDLVANYKGSTNTTYQLGLSYFIPYGYMKGQGFDEETTFAYLQLGRAF